MTTSKEYAFQIADLVEAGKPEEANALIQSLVDDGIIVNNPSPIQLDWRIDLQYAVTHNYDSMAWTGDWHGTGWIDTPAVGYNVQELADDICRQEGVACGRVGETWVNKGIMYINVYEDGDAFPPSNYTYNHEDEIRVSGSLVKDLIMPTPEDDETVTIGYIFTPCANDPELVFSDGYEISIPAGDDLFEFQRAHI